MTKQELEKVSRKNMKNTRTWGHCTVAEIPFTDIVKYFQGCMELDAVTISLQLGEHKIYLVSKEQPKAKRQKALLKVFDEVMKELNIIDEEGKPTEEALERFRKNFTAEYIEKNFTAKEQQWLAKAISRQKEQGEQG